MPLNNRLRRGVSTRRALTNGAPVFLPEVSPTRVAVQAMSCVGFPQGGIILRHGIPVLGLTAAVTLCCSFAVEDKTDGNPKTTIVPLRINTNIRAENREFMDG